MHPVSRNAAELPPPGVHQRASHFRQVILPIVTEIRGHRTRAQIDLLAQDRVADIAQVTDVGAGENQRVLDFDRIANVATVANGGGASKIAVRTNLAVGPNHHVALDKDARKNPRTRP